MEEKYTKSGRLALAIAQKESESVVQSPPRNDEEEKSTVLPWARSNEHNTNVAVEESSPLPMEVCVSAAASRLGSMALEPTAATEDTEDMDATADTEHGQQKAAKRSKSTRVPVFTSQELQEVTKSLESREERLLQKLGSLAAKGDAQNKRPCLETELEKVRFYLDKAASEKELIAAAGGERE